MDQKSPNQLDPKLKAIYENVMGGTATPNPTIQNPTPPIIQSPVVSTSTVPIPPIQPVQPLQPTISPVNATIPKPPILAAAPVTSPIQPTQSIPSPIANPYLSMRQTQPQPTASIQTPIPTQKKKMSKTILLIPLGIIFLVAYAIFWIKFFGIKLPFLP